MVKPSTIDQVYSFTAQVPGLSAMSGSYAAFPLWETKEQLIKDIWYCKASKKVYFTVPANCENGSTVIGCGFNNNNTWKSPTEKFTGYSDVQAAWHIWVTDAKDQTYGGITVLDRNVGASYAPAMRFVEESIFTPVDACEYESNMTILAVVKNGDEILQNVQEIAVFDGAVCLASATMENDGFFYLTVPGDKNLTGRLSIVAVINGNIVETSTSFYFSEDAMLGDYDAPFAVTVGNSTTIGKMLAEGNYNSMRVVDFNGRVFYTGTVANFNENDLHDGQYIFEFITEVRLLSPYNSHNFGD